MKFKKAVQAIPSIAGAYKTGLKALRDADRARIDTKKPRNLAGSVDLDTALLQLFSQEPRWDYGIGIRNSSQEEAIWVEVHPASSHHVDDMLEKLVWLKTWLSNDGHPLKRITTRFIWISSGSVAITAGSPHRKRIAKAGLEFCGERLVLM